MEYMIYIAAANIAAMVITGVFLVITSKARDPRPFSAREMATLLMVSIFWPLGVILLMAAAADKHNE